jgi:hypothetical protein
VGVPHPIELDPAILDPILDRLRKTATYKSKSSLIVTHWQQMKQVGTDCRTLLVNLDEMCSRIEGDKDLSGDGISRQRTEALGQLAKIAHVPIGAVDRRARCKFEYAPSHFDPSRWRAVGLIDFL